MSWSGKRKFGYFSGFIILIALLAGVPVFFTFYKAPTCSDSKQNGDERGVDCGGSCTRLCPADFVAPKVLWSQSSRIVSGVYNAIAYAQNPNASVGAEDVPYAFKLYDLGGILIAERKGRASIPAGSKFAVFESGIRTGERIPARTTFEFADTPEWTPRAPIAGLKVVSVDTSAAGTGTRSEARVKNELVDSAFVSVDAIIILYDISGNEVAFSRTVIDKLAPGETKTLYFTWPEPVAESVVKSEILFSASR